jgi:Restriction endonuclease
MKAAQAIGTHTDDEWQELLREFPYCMWCCNKNVQLEKDHIIPVSTPGSSDHISNLQPLCKRCNLKKGTQIINFVSIFRLSTMIGDGPMQSQYLNIVQVAYPQIFLKEGEAE